MVRSWVLLCLTTLLCRSSQEASPAPTPNEIFARARDSVLLQLKQATNYTCTEIVDRNYFASLNKTLAYCPSQPTTLLQHEYMRDRLRLDVAVSDAGEIFSWHGGDTFSSAGIETIVKSGAISSGSFVGYLHNIFVKNGVVLQYTGRIATSPTPTYYFNYTVPMASSNQHLQVGSKKAVVPFHGTFSIDSETFQLVGLRVNIDEPPQESQICSAVMSIQYQMIDISKVLSLVPRSYMLDMTLIGNRISRSKTEFTDCHAFRGESRISYTDLSDKSDASAQPPRVETLPQNVSLHAAIRSQIDSEHSFTGDPVEAVLLSPVKVRRRRISIPKGARLKGVITRLEFYFDPEPHYVLSIRLDRIIDGNVSYLFKARLQTPETSKLTLSNLYRGNNGRRLAGPGAAGSGEFVFVGKTFRTNHQTDAIWITDEPEGE